MKESFYFPTHAHCEYSQLDGLGSVAHMVQRVGPFLGQPAMSLTDHGNMAGAISLYRETKKHDMKCFPGTEAYLVSSVKDKDAKEKRYHIILLALNYKGYKALVKLSSRSFQRDRFHRRPLIDMSDLRLLSKVAKKDVAITTGCFFGIVVQTLVNDGYARAVKIIKALSGMFPNMFVELQNHGIVHEDRLDEQVISDQLIKAANELGLPVLLGQDSHYVFADEQPAHDLMKDICYFGDTDDNRFPGGPFHLASVPWLRRRWDGQVWAKIEEGHEHLLSLNKLRLPALDTYKFCVPEVPSAEFWLKKRAKYGLEDFYHDKDQEYIARVKYELDVMLKKGVASYIMIMYDIAKWCRDNGVFINVRGSANGSLVCYLLKITNIDSIKWDTSFDRFLSMDRKKPPDIDIDVEADRRQDLIDYIVSKHPGTIQIGTWSRIGLAKREEGDLEADRKGSLMVQYMAAHRKKDPSFNGKVARQDWEPLEQLAELDARKSAGAHAAGFVLPSADRPIGDYLATMLIPSSGLTVTQAPMDDVEDAGYVKVDILGLRALSTFRRTVEALGKDPIKDGMDWIPDDDKKSMKALNTGRAGTGIFQFDGYATASGAKGLGVRSTYDAIVALALFRPAMMSSGMTDLYIKARKRQRRIKVHEMIDPFLSDTWGVPVFQEQVLSIMSVVGLDVDQINDILKAVKASNDKIGEYAEETFDKVYPSFIRRAMNNLDCDRQTAENIWNTVTRFSDYGFNKGHATGYGLMSYRMAYLKTHYLKEFVVSLLASWAGTDKEKVYVGEARRLGLQIGRPDVNKSGATWTLDRSGTLRRGLVSIKDVGEKAAVAIAEERKKGGKYTSISNMVERLPARPVTGGKDWKKQRVLKGVFKALWEAQALGTFVGE